MYKNKIIILFILFLLPISAIAGSSATPEEVVSKYCQLDFEGARLNGSTWSKVYPLITWEEEAGWDVVVPIKNFKITSTSQEKNNATVKVQYDFEREVHGVNPDQLTYKQKIVDFKLIKQGDTWKINSPKIYPHVSAEALKRK